MPLSLITLGFPDDCYASWRDSSLQRTLTLHLRNDGIGSGGADFGSVAIPVAGGSVIADAGSSPRYAATVMVQETNVPTGWLDTLAFTGTCQIVEQIETAYAHVTCDVILFSGYVDEVQTERPSGLVTLTLTGWEGRIREDTATTTSKPSATGTVADLIESLIRRTYAAGSSFVTVHRGGGLDVTQTVEPGYTIAPGDDVLQHILDLAKSIGAECYAPPPPTTSGSTGNSIYFQLQPVPGTNDIPNRQNLVTPETVLIDSLEATRRAVNRTRMRYEPAQPTTAKPARTGAAEITSGPQDPDTMGRVTEWQRRTGYRTQALADTYAGRLLRQRSRKTRSVSWHQLPAPWVAPGDTVPVRTRSLAAFPTATTRNLIVNRLDYPLGAVEPMTVVARGDYA